MALPPRSGNILRGGGKKLAGEVRGFKELELKFRDLEKSFAGGPEYLTSTLAADKRKVIGESAEMIASAARANASAKNVPRRVQQSIFSYLNPSKDRPRRSSALVGVNKQRTKVEWFPARSKSRRAKSLVIPTAPGAGFGSQGGKIAMSLATMFERGTSRMRDRAYFTPAVRSMRSIALTNMTTGLAAVIEKWGRKP